MVAAPSIPPAFTHPAMALIPRIQAEDDSRGLGHSYTGPHASWPENAALPLPSFPSQAKKCRGFLILLTSPGHWRTDWVVAYEEWLNQ